jgi:hypothetical protein
LRTLAAKDNLSAIFSCINQVANKALDVIRMNDYAVVTAQVVLLAQHHMTHATGMHRDLFRRVWAINSRVSPAFDLVFAVR